MILADTVARWLAVGGLGLSACATVIGVLSYRRDRVRLKWSWTAYYEGEPRLDVLILNDGRQPTTIGEASLRTWGMDGNPLWKVKLGLRWPWLQRRLRVGGASWGDPPIGGPMPYQLLRPGESMTLSFATNSVKSLAGDGIDRIFVEVPDPAGRIVNLLLPSDAVSSF